VRDVAYTYDDVGNRKTMRARILDPGGTVGSDILNTIMAFLLSAGLGISALVMLGMLIGECFPAG